MKIQLYEYPQHDILRKPCRPAGEITVELRQLLEDMVPFMREHAGVGLAAPQIGDDRRFFVMEFGGVVYKVIDPVILSRSADTDTRREACLSVPRMAVDIVRSISVTVRFTDELGREREMTLQGMPARIFQHEYDHLEGCLIVDHMDFTQGMSE